jgi:hypothetical protein
VMTVAAISIYLMSTTVIMLYNGRHGSLET